MLLSLYVARRGYGSRGNVRIVHRGRGWLRSGASTFSSLRPAHPQSMLSRSQNTYTFWPLLLLLLPCGQAYHHGQQIMEGRALSPTGV